MDSLKHAKEIIKCLAAIVEVGPTLPPQVNISAAHT